MRGLVVASVFIGAVIGAACGGGSEGDGAGARAVSAEPEVKAPRGAAAKPEGEPRAEGKGLAARVDELVQAADPPDPVLPPGVGVAIPAVIPPGEILIEHECRHSAEPSGTSYWSEKLTVDLAKGTIASVRVEGGKVRRHGFFGMKKKQPEKRMESQTNLAPGIAANIRAALDRVLAGGPYAPVYAAPEGIVCTLALRVGEEQPFFEIDKSRVEREDSVTRLIDAMGGKGKTPP